MKNKNKLLSVLASTLITSIAFAQTARVQVIHNSPDPLVDTVDVWLDNSKILDNVAFREASGFINATAGSPITIGLAPKTSTLASQSLATFPLTLTPNATYVVVANGLSGLTTGYNPFQQIDLDIFATGREIANNNANTDVLVAHGSTDAPTVDVYAVGAGTLINNLSYGQFSNNYLELPTADYKIQVRNQAGTDVVAEYSAPLQTLGYGGDALVVVASGFLNPANNNNGPAFGLYVAPTSGGPLLPLPSSAITTARVQVLHNSADLAADTVDVWLNGARLIDNFAFRTASPFVDAPAGTPIVIDIAAKNSTSSIPAIASFSLTLTGNEKYVVVANGIVSSSGYSPSPNFDLDIFAQGREIASNSSNTDLLVAHGSTDAPTVDVYAVGVGTPLVDNIAYGQFANDYLELPTADYKIQVRNQAGTDVVAEYSAPLQTLGLSGDAFVIVASGFLSPTTNSNGPAFGLFAVPDTGGAFLPLQVSSSISTARLQIIHNSADLAADSVDIWLNNIKELDNFSFRRATGFIDVDAGVPIQIGVAPKTSTVSTQAFSTFTVTLTGNEKYIAIANGIASTSGYSPAKPFNLEIYNMAREVGSSSSNVDLLVFHGCTDAPMVDVFETAVLNVNAVNDLDYADFDGYLSLPENDYTLEVRTQQGAAVARYSAPLQTLNLEGTALTVLASGFLNPSNNSNGAAFGLWVATAAGGNLIQLPVLSGVGINEAEKADLIAFPNPVNDIANVVIPSELENATVRVLNSVGQSVLFKANISAKNNIYSIDMSNLTNGVYFIELVNSTSVSNIRVIKQ